VFDGVLAAVTFNEGTAEDRISRDTGVAGVEMVSNDRPGNEVSGGRTAVRAADLDGEQTSAAC